MSESKTLGAAQLSLSATSNRKWWQRLLLYPTVVGAAERLGNEVVDDAELT